MQFRVTNDDRWSFPLSPESVDMISTIASKKSLTPRRLTLYFNYVLLVLLDSDPPENGFEYEQVSQYLEDEQLGNLDFDTPKE